MVRDYGGERGTIHGQPEDDLPARGQHTCHSVLRGLVALGLWAPNGIATTLMRAWSSMDGAQYARMHRETSAHTVINEKPQSTCWRAKDMSGGKGASVTGAQRPGDYSA